MAQTIPYAQNSFAGGEWDSQLLPAVDLAKYKTACKSMRNFFGHVNGRASNRPGLLYSCQTALSTTNQSAVQNVRLIPFVFSTTQSYVLEFGHQYMRVIKNGALIMSGPSTAFTITTPYTSAMVMQLGYTQSADTIFLAHPSVAPRILQRISDTNWMMSTYNFTGGPFLLDNTTTSQTITAQQIGVGSPAQALISTGASVTLTATNCQPFVSTQVGALWELFHYVPNQSFTGTATSGPTSSVNCGGTWRMITNGTWTGSVWIEKSLDGGVTWNQLNIFYGVDDYNANTFGTEDMSNNAPPFLIRGNSNITSGAVQWKISADPYIQAGIVSITSFQSSTSVRGIVQQPIGLSNDPTSDWAEGAWSTYRGWPSVVEFTPDDRLAWANTPFQPITSFISKTSNYYNFNVSDPLVDSDALNINLPSRQLNAITALLPLRAILALTSGAEWSIESISGVTAPLTPNTVYQRVHGYEGATSVRPISIGIRGLFVQYLGKVLRDVGYELVYDAFVGANISLFSNHLFYFDNIIDMCYCQNPDSLVHLVMQSGKLVTLTYLREQSVVTFAPQDTYGKFMSCCSIADAVNNYNVPYFVVNRANGQFIEYMPKRMQTTNIQDQYFVDCGGIYDALGQTFQNPDFESWMFGPNAAPDSWTLVQSGTVSQVSAAVSTSTQLTNVENGSYSAKLQGANPILYQRMDQAFGATYWQTRTVTFSAWARCSTTNTACASIYDGVGTTQSSFHTGDGTWQLLSVTRTINGGATLVRAQCQVVSGTAYFDNTYFNSGVSSISALTWLNGQTVSILADGNILPQTTVQSGVISWDGTNYNKVIYGLPYVAQLQPVNPEIVLPTGTIQGRVTNIGKNVIKFWNSAGGYCGTDFNSMLPIPDLQITSYDTPPPLLTDDVKVLPAGGYKDNNSICIQQTDPLPMTVCSIISELQVGGIAAQT